MERFIHIVTRHPKLVISLAVLAIVILAIPLPGISINSDLQALIDEHDPDLTRMEELEDIFGGLDVVLITYRTQDVFSPAALSIIDSITEKILDLPFVDQVHSLTQFESIRTDDDMMTVDNFLDVFPVTPTESDSIAALAHADPLISRVLVSEDRRNTAIIVYPSEDILDEEIRQGLERVIAPFQASGEELKLGGMAIIRDEISRDIATDTTLFIPLGMVLIMLLLFFSFRSGRGVVLPMLVVVLSIMGTLGLMTWLGMQLTIISSIIPVMLIAVASAYGIHIMTRYYEDHQKNPELDRHQVVAKGMRQLAKPIFMAALTTMIGFMALLSHVLPASQEVGVLTSFGVFLAFLLSVTIIPAALVLVPRPQVGERKHLTANNMLARTLAGIGRLVYRHRLGVILLFGALTVLAISGIPRIVVDSNPLNYYPPHAEIRQVNAVFDEHFGGSTTLSVVVDGDIKEPAVLRQIETIQTYLDSQDIVGYTLSINDFIKTMNQAMNGGVTDKYTIPDSRQLVSQYLLVYSWESSDSYLDSYVDYDYQSAQIVVHINTMDVRRMIDLQQRLNIWLSENITVENQPKSEGYAVLLGNLVPQMIRGQTRSLIISVILLAMVTGLIFRSFSAALISSMPLAFAITVVFGLMGYFNIYLTTATSMISSIMIGIGIDYTIHFLFRYRSEIRAGRSDEEAIMVSLSTTGQGIVINAVSVMIGFAVCMFSSFIPIYFFGWLIVVSIGICLIAALTLLPVVLLNVRPAFIYRPKRS